MTTKYLFYNFDYIEWNIITGFEVKIKVFIIIAVEVKFLFSLDLTLQSQYNLIVES